MGRYGKLAEELKGIVDGDTQPDRASLEEDDDCGCGSLRGALDVIEERRGRIDLLRDEP